MLVLLKDLKYIARNVDQYNLLDVLHFNIELEIYLNNQLKYVSEKIKEEFELLLFYLEQNRKILYLYENDTYDVYETTYSILEKVEELLD